MLMQLSQLQMEHKENTSLSKKQFNMYKIILEIIEQRGYAVNEDYKKMEYQEYLDRTDSGVIERHVFYPLDADDAETSGSIAVFYNFQRARITEEYIKKMIQLVNDVKRFILIVPTVDKGKVSTMDIDKKALQMIHELGRKDRQDKSESVRIELFKDEDLMFNVLKHELVPDHKVLSQKEKQELLKKYKVKESQLPKILLADPVAKFLGLRRDQVVKISRKSQTAGTYITYRIAV